jgi:hypothetical protein
MIACRGCRFFDNRPLAIAAGLPLIASLSSVHGSIWADDGLCLRHDRLVPARGRCGDYAPPGLAQGE